MENNTHFESNIAVSIWHTFKILFIYFNVFYIIPFNHTRIPWTFIFVSPHYSQLLASDTASVMIDVCD